MFRPNCFSVPFLFILVIFLKLDYSVPKFFNITLTPVAEITMKEKTDKSNAKEEIRTLRKKTKRIEESRALIKAKSAEKGKIIKAYQDRQTELEQNRDDWKVKCKEQESERIKADDRYKQVAALFDMKEEQFRELLKEVEELKKKYPPKKRR